MKVGAVVGLSRIGLRTADGCFFPVMLESFRGMKQIILTTVSSQQVAVSVELFLEEPGGGKHYNYLGSLRIDNIVAGDLRRPDLVLRVGIDADRVLTAVLKGPEGSSDLRVLLKRYSSGDCQMHREPGLMDPRTLITAGHLEETPLAGVPDAATALSQGSRQGEPIELFVHRSTSVLPLNVEPYDLPRINCFTDRVDLIQSELEALRSIYGRLAQEQDPEQSHIGAAGLRSLKDRKVVESPDSDESPSAPHVQSAFDKGEYGDMVRLLQPARDAGLASETEREVIDYWFHG